MKVEKHIKGAVRQFAYWFAHGTIGGGLLAGIDYVSQLQEESSFAEQAFVIFMNHLEYDENGVINYKQAEYRAAQFVRKYFDASYTVDPPFEDWETEADSVSEKAWNQ